MMKNLVHLEHKVEDRIYTFICPEKATLGELHDALHTMKDLVVTKINELMAQDKAQKDQKSPEVKE